MITQNKWLLETACIYKKTDLSCNSDRLIKKTFKRILTRKGKYNNGIS